ncbi:hypothetical protein LCGC14_1455430 [marine sediment metagenome]|uniref:Uncharacterized protein n=1 Tax=marine sediment metagenome TaxID=412755 RepID=A0A0F9JGK1_9ZZZZ
MAVEVRTTPTRANVGDVVNPAANTAREQIAANQILDWTLRGFVFTGGAVLMDATDIASVTSIADTTPDYVLQSPLGTATVVIPLRVRCSVTNDGGGLTVFDLVYTKAKQETATALAFTSGTALKIQNNYTPNPMATSKSSLEYTVTSAALTNVDTAVIAHAHMVDAGLTTGLIQLNEVFDYSFQDSPIALTEGAALLLYTSTTGGAGKTRATFTWAELPRDVYVP